MPPGRRFSPRLSTGPGGLASRQAPLSNPSLPYSRQADLESMVSSVPDRSRISSQQIGDYDKSSVSVQHVGTVLQVGDGIAGVTTCRGHGRRIARIRRWHRRGIALKLEDGTTSGRWCCMGEGWESGRQHVKAFRPHC